jgi:hypothetical protein
MEGVEGDEKGRPKEKIALRCFMALFRKKKTLTGLSRTCG